MYVIIIYFLLSIFVLLAEFNFFQQKKAKFFINIIYLAIFIFFIFRMSLGPDIRSYIFVYQRVHSFFDFLFYHMQRNIGFNTFSYVSKLIFKENYIYFFLLIDLLSGLLCAYTIYKNSKNILFSLLLFIGSGFLEVYFSSGIRQMLAMSIFFYSYFFFYLKNKSVLYYIGCFLAISFHEISIVALFIPLLGKYSSRIMNRYQKYFSIGIISSFVLSFIPIMLMPLLAKFIGSESVITHILIYFENTSYSMVGYALQLLIFVLVLVSYIFVAEEYRTFEFQMYVLISYLSLIIYILLGGFSIISRVCDYLQIILIIGLVNIIRQIKESKKKICLIIIQICLNAFLLYSDLTFKIGRMNENEGMGLTIYNYPYISIFDPNIYEIYK